MGKEEFIKLAEKMRDKTATDEERLMFIREMKSALGEVSDILKAAKERKAKD